MRQDVVRGRFSVLTLPLVGDRDTPNERVPELNPWAHPLAHVGIPGGIDAKSGLRFVLTRPVEVFRESKALVEMGVELV